MRTLLICHEDEVLNQVGMARWLASFSDLAGVVTIREESSRMRARIRREIKRIGLVRFLDVLAFRIYYKVKLAAHDAAIETQILTALEARFPPHHAPELITASPNSAESRKFIRDAAPDIVIARCKTLLAERVFSIPTVGTFVMHPGVCPEYRNAHGCFWALSRRDLERVGMTLLRIDKGVDTGAVFGYFTYPYDERSESHITIQDRVVFDNLDAIEAKLEEIYSGEAVPIPTAGRDSAAWGQPWLTRYLAWKKAAASGRAR